jgi:serine/threonine protein kinase
MFFDNANKSKVISKMIPSLPEGVKLDDLDNDGRLIPPEFIHDLEKLIIGAMLEDRIKESDNMLISKKSLSPDLKYSIVKLNGKEGPDYFAVYKGKGSELGRGAFGKVVIAQNIVTGKWYALKKQVLRAEKKEFATKLAQAENKHLIDLDLSPKIPVKVRMSPSKQVEQYIILMNLEEGKTFSGLVRQQESFGMPTIPNILRLQIPIELLKAGKMLVKEKNLLHRDLKEANCIAKLSTLRTVLIDFGLTVNQDLEGEHRANHLVGSLETTAAELRVEWVKQRAAKEEGREYQANFIFNEKTEIYAYGIIIAGLFNLWNNAEASDDVADWKEKSFIIDESDELFINNESMPSDKNGRQLLKEMLECVTQMTNYDDNDTKQEHRFSFDQSIEALEQIKNKYIASYTEAPLKIGVLDINQYYKTALNEKKEPQMRSNIDMKDMHRIFASMDEIVLIDTSGKDRGMAFYQNVKEEIKYSKEALMIVHDVVLIGSDRKEIEKEVTKYLKPIAEKVPISFNMLNCPLVQTRSRSSP